MATDIVFSRRIRRARLPIVLLAFFLLAAPATSLADSTYAVLFSGGGDVNNNFDRYYNQTLRMWNDATALFGVNNVYVLFADGLDNGVDRTNNASVQVNSDWSAITNAGGNIDSATEANLQTTMTIIGEQMNPFTSFYFWSFDHGDVLTGATAGVGSDVALIPWAPGDVLNEANWITDQELANMANNFAGAKAEAFAFAQCHSGGMVDELMAGTHPPRFAAWAAAADECSFGDGWANQWANAVENPQLRKSTNAMGEFARINDPFGPGGNNTETPGWTGADFDFLTNEAVPEPASLLLLGGGLLTLAAARRKRQ